MSHGGDFWRSVRAALGLRVEDTREVWRYGRYRALVVAQASDLSTVDVSFDGGILPGMKHVPVKFAAGIKVQFGQGDAVEVGWERGDERRVYAAPLSDGITPIKVVVEAPAVYLGEETGAQLVAQANKVLSELQAVASALSVHTHTIPAGGSTGPSNSTYTAGSVAAANVYAK